MALKRQKATVELAGVEAPVRLEFINPDYLRVEADLPKFGLPNNPKKTPQAYMTCVAWAACKRLGLYHGELLDFLYRDCVVIEYDKDAEKVRPTQPEEDTPSP